MSAAYETFWLEVRRRRRLFFLWWIAWLPLGLIAAIAFSTLLGEVGAVGGWVILLSWFVPWIFIVRRLSRLTCPRCGKPAIAHQLFFMRHAGCQHCGLRPNKTMEPTHVPFLCLISPRGSSLSLGHKGMKHLQIKDCAVLIGLNPDGDCVYSASMSLGEYWDGEHPWDSDTQVRKLKLQKMVGFLFGPKGNLQQFESTFDLKTGVFKAGWARHEGGTVKRFGRPTSRSTRSRAIKRAPG